MREATRHNRTTVPGEMQVTSLSEYALSTCALSSPRRELDLWRARHLNVDGIVSPSAARIPRANVVFSCSYVIAR